MASKEADLSNDTASGKYMEAGRIANAALQTVLDACVDGASIYDLCVMGDAYITKETGLIYNQKVQEDSDSENEEGEGRKMEKGVAFPTCVSVNHECGNQSPWMKEDDQLLKKGDQVKVDLSVHINGFIAAVAHTKVVDAEPTANQAKVMKAAWTGLQALIRTIRPGVHATEVPRVINLVTQEFENVQACTGPQCSELRQHVIDTANQVAIRPMPDEKLPKFTFEKHQVWAVEVVVSNGEGRLRLSDKKRPSIYKREYANTYALKTPKTRKFMGIVNKNYPSLPFNLRSFDDPTVAKIGVSEAERNQMISPYHPMNEKEGVDVCHFKFTVGIFPSGVVKVIAGLQTAPNTAGTPEISGEGEVAKILQVSMYPKEQKKALKA
jgi:curved DNA binding protein